MPHAAPFPKFEHRPFLSIQKFIWGWQSSKVSKSAINSFILAGHLLTSSHESMCLACFIILSQHIKHKSWFLSPKEVMYSFYSWWFRQPLFRIDKWMIMQGFLTGFSCMYILLRSLLQFKLWKPGNLLCIEKKNQCNCNWTHPWVMPSFSLAIRNI